MTSHRRSFAVIAGGGPVGMVPAPELGWRDIRCVPLAVLAIGDAKARALYGRDHALVGPDQIVYWRGDAAPPDPAAPVDRVRGA